jgi:transcriptional regulator GlxA family with amidase domain
MLQIYGVGHTWRVARKTSFEGSTPKRRRATKPRLIAVLAFDGVVLADLATPCEVLARARASDGTPAYELRVCSERPKVFAEHVSLHVPWRLPLLARADTIIVPGIDELDRLIPDAVTKAIRAAIQRGARVASICTGAFVLAATGVLDGLRATTHWLVASELARRHPRITVDANVLYIDNGRILTSAGAAAGLDLCLYLVRRDLGAEAAARTARAVVMPLERAGGQAQFIAYEPPSETGTPIGRLAEWIAGNLTGDLSLPSLARRAAMSTRTLCRRFHEQIGETPAAWIARARVARAQRLLETTDRSVEEVATAVGLRSSTVLRDHFARILGTTPGGYRQSFARGSGRLAAWS